MANKSSKMTVAAGKAPTKAILSPLLAAEGENEILDLIATTLDLAHTARHPLCLLALTTALLRLFDDHIRPSESYVDNNFAENFRLAHPDFVSSVLDFLVRQQSLETNQAMIETIQICSCDKRHRLIHTLHIFPPPPEGVEPWKEPFRVITLILWRLLMIITEDLALAKVNRMKERKKTRSKDAGYERFVHYMDTDPESLVRAVSVWFKQTFHTSIMRLLLQVLSIQPSSIERALGTVPELAQYMQEAVSNHVTIVLKSRRMEDAQLAALNGNLLFLQLFIARFSESASKSFFGPHARAIYQDTLSMITRLEKAGTFPGSDKLQVEILPRLGTHASNMHKHLPKEMRDRTSLPNHVKEYADSGYNGPTGLNTPYTFIWGALCYYSKSRKCLHVKCGKLPPTSIKSWKRCARCKIVSYCSESCQKAAWTNPEAPHKDMCKDWSKLRTVWHIDGTALTKEPFAYGLLDMNVGLKDKAAPIGLAEIEILKTFQNITKFGLEINKQLGSGTLEG